jgi:hypothetical protein
VAVGVRVLITSIEYWSRTGAVLYVRDLALELRRQGHLPAVYALERGAASNGLREMGIQIVGNLRQLRCPPEVIHGHHYATTLSAVQYFPGIPAIFVCHNHANREDKTPFHPRIRRYFGVSRLCVERLTKEGVSESNARLLLNFVDTKRFHLRPLLPDHPRRALVFSNYAHAGTHLPAVGEACRRAGLELDVVGTGVGRPVAKPEAILGSYDIVFAKAKAAMEAMAVGAAVVLCDFGGVGPMVTAKEFEDLRPLNFGFQALRAPLRPENVLCQIARYDPRDAARVCELLRASASLDQATTDLVGIYGEVIEEQKEVPSGHAEQRVEYGLAQERVFGKLSRAWGSLSPRQRELLRRLPGVGEVVRRVRGLMSNAQ